MNYGYSSRCIASNAQADDASLGVRLGRLCIEHNVPVLKIAKELGVSRATVYNWFSGNIVPSKGCTDRILWWLDKNALGNS